MGRCPCGGGFVVSVDVDLGDIKTAVAKYDRGGFQVGGRFNGGGCQVMNSQFLRLVRSMVRLIVSMNEGPRELL